MSNKLYSEESIQAIANSIRAKNGTSETYTVSEMSTAINVLPTDLTTKTITANGTYNASSDDADGYSSVTVAVEGYAKKSISNTPCDIATFTASALPMPSLKIGIEATQSGIGDPSPQNVRPISGWSAVNVYRRGKNLFEVTATSKTESGVTWTVNSDGTVTVSGTATGYTSIYVGEAKVKSSMGKVTISGISGTTNIAWGYLDLKDENDNTLYNITSGSTYSNFIVDLSQYPSAYKITMTIKRNNNGDVSGTIKPQVELGDTATTYEAFSGTTYTTTLKDGQGNPLACYGGQLSNVNGVQSLKKTFDDRDLSTLQTWTFIGTYGTATNVFRAYYPLKDCASSQVYNALCESYKMVSRDVLRSGADLTIALYKALNEEYGTIFINDTNYNDVTAFVASINGVHIVYETPTPQTIPQDNLAIASQDGINNLWADSGDIQSGEYMEAL